MTFKMKNKFLKMLITECMLEGKSFQRSLRGFWKAVDKNLDNKMMGEKINALRDKNG